MSVAAALMLSHFADASFLHGSSYHTWLHYLPPLENIKCPTKNLQKASCILPVIKSDQQSLSHAQCDRPRHGADGITLHY
jgi:hypothetical protein